jgi:hypothetical protein
MLTALTSTLLLGMLLQDTAPAAAPARENDPKALAILEQFDQRLYHPGDHGLKSLSFDMEMPGPMGASGGTLSVKWNAEGGASGDFVMSEAMKTMLPEQALAQMEQMMAVQMNRAAAQIATVQTNRFVRDLLGDSTVKLEGAEDGYLKIACDPNAGTEGMGRTLFFEDGMLVKMAETVMGPMGKMESQGSMEWAASEKGSDLLVLETNTESAGDMQQSSRFMRRKIAGFLLVTKLEGSVTGQPPSVIEFTNFVVNGKPASLEAESDGEDSGEG